MILYTASGKLFNLSMFLESKKDGFCYIHIIDSDLQTIVETFGNPKEADILTYGDKIIHGYKTLTKIEIEDSYIFITLHREYDI